MQMTFLIVLRAISLFFFFSFFNFIMSSGKKATHDISSITAFYLTVFLHPMFLFKVLINSSPLTKPV